MNDKTKVLEIDSIYLKDCRLNAEAKDVKFSKI